MPSIGWGHSQYWSGSGGPPPPGESEYMTGEEVLRDPIFREPTIGIIRKYGWYSPRGTKSDPFDGIKKNIETKHNIEIWDRQSKNAEARKFREGMLAKQYLSKLRQTEVKRLEQVLLDEAKKAGIKLSVSKPPVNIDKLGTQYRDQLAKEEASRRRRELEQRMEDEKKLANKIKMARVRSHRKKK